MAQEPLAKRYTNLHFAPSSALADVGGKAHEDRTFPMHDCMVVALFDLWGCLSIGDVLNFLVNELFQRSWWGIVSPCATQAFTARIADIITCSSPETVGTHARVLGKSTNCQCLFTSPTRLARRSAAGFDIFPSGAEAALFGSSRVACTQAIFRQRCKLSWMTIRTLR